MGPLLVVLFGTGAPVMSGPVPARVIPGRWPVWAGPRR